MTNLRTPEAKRKYKEYQHTMMNKSDACDLCSKLSLKTFEFWKITNNDFPYDLIAKTHHMLLPIRHTVESGLSKAELEELIFIKGGYLNEGYDYLIEPTHKNKSIPDHFHIHLIVSKI